MREERVDASLVLRRLEDELGFAILLPDCIVMADRDRAVGVAVQGSANAEYDEIHAIGENCQAQDAEKRGAKDPPQPLSQIRRRGLVHEAELYA